MKIEEKGMKPIFVQIQEGIEDAILSGAFPEESQIPSTTEISTTYQINPATALKGINILVAERILYKKRGIGMFVADGATEILRKKRQKDFLEDYVEPLIAEALRLQITEAVLVDLIEKGYKK
ncbi:MAG: GntR family transcriptional regulator [Tissierellia bacterium]|nr:GntR family transcriptional regulator [Tissierellia bacterium]